MARGKSLNDIQKQYQRIRTALITRGTDRDYRNGYVSSRMQTIVNARKRYMDNIGKTASAKKNLANFLKERGATSNAAWEKFNNTKYARSTYMGLANG